MGRTIRPSDVVSLAPEEMVPSHRRANADYLARHAAHAARHAEERAERKRRRAIRLRAKRKA